MEKSNPTNNYDEITTTSEPTIKVTKLDDDFNHRSSIDTNPRFVINSEFQSQQPTFMSHQPDSYGSYCDRLFRNRRQVTSISGGLTLMLNSGLHIGWGIWRVLFAGVWQFTNTGIVIFTLMSWYVGAFLGGFAGAILLPILRKDTIYQISAAVLIVGNVVLLIRDEDAEAIASGRILAGLAHGLAFVTLITHAGENAVKSMRGMILSIVNCMLYTGIFVAVVITGAVRIDFSGSPETLSGERILAIVSILMAVISFALSMMMPVESVPFLLRRNSQEHAMINLKLLRNTRHETLSVTQEMDEFHSMIIQDQRDDWNIFTDGNSKPLAFMILIRLMVALTNNFLINYHAVLFATELLLTRQARLAPLIIVAPRLTMSMLQIFYADILKRKIQVFVPSFLAAIILLVIGILVNTLSIFDDWRIFRVAITSLWICFQFTCSLGMDQMQDVYLSEAFSTAKKPWSLPCVVAFEHLFHIFMIGMYFVGVYTTAHFNIMIFVTAGVLLLFSIILILTLPETRNMSLKEARDAFINYSVNIKSPFA